MIDSFLLFYCFSFHLLNANRFTLIAHPECQFCFAVLPTSALQLSQGGDGLHSGGSGTIVQYATQSQDGQFFVPGKCVCAHSIHPSVHPSVFPSGLCHLNELCAFKSNEPIIRSVPMKSMANFTHHEHYLLYNLFKRFHLFL